MGRSAGDGDCAAPGPLFCCPRTGLLTSVNSESSVSSLTRWECVPYVGAVGSLLSELRESATGVCWGRGSPFPTGNQLRYFDESWNRNTSTRRESPEAIGTSGRDSEQWKVAGGRKQMRVVGSNMNTSYRNFNCPWSQARRAIANIASPDKPRCRGGGHVRRRGWGSGGLSGPAGRSRRRASEDGR